MLFIILMHNPGLSAFFFAFADKELEGKDVDLRAIASLLVGGIYYLVLHKKNTDSTFCEIDLTEEKGMERIRRAVGTILGWAFSDK